MGIRPLFYFRKDSVMKFRSLAGSLFSILALSLCVVFVGCSDMGYYNQAVRGHLDLIARRQPVTELLKHEALAPGLKEDLTLALSAREFAVKELLLPDNGSFRSYVDMERDAVTWNVVAAPELNLAPVLWCFPVAGCVPYRGYFSRQEAESYSDGLRRQGYDVFIYGVRAYSTLGWFEDPLLNTFFGRPSWEVVQLIFHELAHQLLYVKGDAFFNEAFAETVAYEGVMRWLEKNGTDEDRLAFEAATRRSEEFVDLILETRKRLVRVYLSDDPQPRRRAQKEEVIAWLQTSYEKLKSSWGGYRGYDAWFGSNLNNAKLASVGTYHLFAPAFRLMLAQSNGSLEKFYASARALAALPQQERQQRVENLRLAARKGLPGGKVY